MRTLLMLVFGFVIAWAGSYLAYRWTHAEPSGPVFTTTIPLPSDNPLLMRVYEPLATIDARFTGSVIR